MSTRVLTADKRFNILLIQNDSSIKEQISSMLLSPMVRIECATSIAEVRKKVLKSGTAWHCWILDPNINKYENGVDLMREFNYFPFIIVLSGNGTMRLAFKITQLGALDVFDHLPDNNFDEFIDSVIHTTILGFLLDSKRSDYLSTFLALKKNIVPNVPDWARQTFISQRYLERICEQHFGLPPRYVLPLYYHLFSKFYNTLANVDSHWLTRRYNTNESTFFRSCNEFVKKRIAPAISLYPFVKNRFNLEWLDTDCKQENTLICC
ncbi:MAG: hypothetical protein JW915_24390 [Chitinispirillaceae bacterium]|nr:hypothetical protein [Chitinispirillaceae bacterium]